MKNKYHFAILFTALALFASGFARGQSVTSVYRQGVALFDQKDYPAALKQFERILKVNPRYTPALSYRNKCNIAIKNSGGNNDAMKTTLNGIKLSVKFAEVPIGDVLEYIRQRTTEVSGGKTSPNFIFSGSGAQKENLLVTMNLREVPIDIILSYAMREARCKLRYDEYAITVTPLDSTGSVVTSKAATDSGSELQGTFE